jgi:hypothetical protein
MHCRIESDCLPTAAVVKLLDPGLPDAMRPRHMRVPPPQHPPIYLPIVELDSIGMAISEPASLLEQRLYLAWS